MLPENNTQQHIYLEMRDYKDKTREELLEIIRNLEEQLESRSFPDPPCQNEESDRFRKQYGREILEAIPDMLTVFDYNLDYIELLSAPDTNHVEGLSGEDKSHPNLKDIVPESEYRKIRANMEKVVRTGCPSIGEHSLQFEGETHHYENLVCPLGDKYLLCMCRDVTSRVNAQRELAAARVKAEESDRLKSAFLANMSHEIRTPLNAIVGFSDVISTTYDELSEEERADFVRLISINSEHLVRLIDDILDLSKIESNTIQFTFSNCSLKALLMDIEKEQTMKPISEIEIKASLPNEDVYINTDITRLKQVICNFINNARKFTEKGHIHFGYAIDQTNTDSVQIYVEDTGSGIPQECLNEIFDRFYKVDTFKQGTGLGLSICKTIVEHLQGEIFVESKIGKGSRFTVTLPFERKAEV